MYKQNIGDYSEAIVKSSFLMIINIEDTFWIKAQSMSKDSILVEDKNIFIGRSWG